ncbi:MAG: class I SAM-dependent methyltransferase [Deltaproteobacteria bacterium]|nr:class I SAM-dependent methyltransferase [Deltaproteobacteria bacterium]
MKCYICSSDRIGPYIDINGYLIKRCIVCGHCITTPVPERRVLKKIYDDQYFESHYVKADKGTKEFRKQIRNNHHRFRLLRRFLADGKILDVGCGKGYFLYACKKRYDCSGYDVTDSNRDYIENELGIRLFCGDIDEIGSVFDAITLWHSLEHLRDPRETLKELLQLLRPGGILIAEVPVYFGIDGVMQHHQWPNWDPPFHLHHFSKDSLFRMMEGLGLKILTAKSYLSEYVRSELKRHFFFRIFARSIAGRFEGGSIAVVCKKISI